MIASGLTFMTRSITASTAEVSKKFVPAVIVRGRRDDHEVRVRVCLLPVQRGGQVQFLLREVFLDVLVLNRTNTLVDLLDLLRNDVHRGDLVMLRQQRRKRQAHVASTGNSNFKRIEPMQNFSILLNTPVSNYPPHMDEPSYNVDGTNTRRKLVSVKEKHNFKKSAKGNNKNQDAKDWKLLTLFNQSSVIHTVYVMKR